MDSRKMFHGASPEIFEKAKMPRKHMTKEESILIKVIRFKNSEIREGLGRVVVCIKQVAAELLADYRSFTPTLKVGIDLNTDLNSSLQGVDGKKGNSTNQSISPALKGGCGGRKESYE